MRDFPRIIFDRGELQTGMEQSTVFAIIAQGKFSTLTALQRHTHALKLCLVAEGKADVYPRFGPTMEWDVAAGEAVLRAAGGRVLTPDGAELRYGKAAAGFRNGFFIAWGKAA